MKKLMYITAATLLVAGLAAAPAFAQGTAKTTTKTATTKTATMKKARHATSCYDYAWDSQAQKDCLAGKKPMAKKATKKSMKKAAPKKS